MNKVMCNDEQKDYVQARKRHLLNILKAIHAVRQS